LRRTKRSQQVLLERTFCLIQERIIIDWSVNNKSAILMSKGTRSKKNALITTVQ